MNNVKKNIIYNIIYQLLIIVLPLITAPYIARVMGPEILGQYTYSYSIVYYFSLFILLGLNNYGNRTIAQVRKNKDELSKEFCSIYAMQLCMALIVISVYVVYTYMNICKYRMIATIQIIYLLGSAIDINWFFFGMERFKITITRNMILKLLAFGATFIFVKKPSDIYIYTAILSASNLISQVFLWFFVKKEIKIQKVTFSEINKHIKPNLTLFIPVIAVSLYKIMDKIMLGNMSEISSVAIYENAEKIITVPTSIITAVGTVMLPRMSNLLVLGKEREVKEYIKKSMNLILLVAFPMMFGIMAVSENFSIVYYGSEFAESGIFMKYLSITIIFTSIANVIRTQYLIPKGKDREYIISVSLGAVLNLIANLILIPIIGALGAIISTIIAEFTVMLIQIFAVNKELDICEYFKMALKYCLYGLIMYIMILPIKFIIDNRIICILVQVLMGIIIYLVISIKEILTVFNIRRKK